MTAAQVISNPSQLHCSKSKGPIGFPLIFQCEYKIKNDLPSFIALSLLYLTLKVVMIHVVTVSNLGTQTGSDQATGFYPCHLPLTSEHFFSLCHKLRVVSESATFTGNGNFSLRKTALKNIGC